MKTTAAIITQAATTTATLATMLITVVQAFAGDDLDGMIVAYATLTIGTETCAASWHPRTEEVLIRNATRLLNGSMTLASANRVFELADAKAAEMRASGDTSFNSPFCDMVRAVAQQSWTTIPQDLREP